MEPLNRNKESTGNAGDPGFDPRVGKIPWRRERLLQYSGLENSMDSPVRSQRVKRDWLTFTFFLSTEMGKEHSGREVTKKEIQVANKQQQNTNGQ